MIKIFLCTFSRNALHSLNYDKKISVFDMVLLKGNGLADGSKNIA